MMVLCSDELLLLNLLDLLLLLLLLVSAEEILRVRVCNGGGLAMEGWGRLREEGGMVGVRG